MCEMYNFPVNYTNIKDDSTENHHSSCYSEGIIEEDKVILEAEIALRTGPNITMKIHEESRPNSVASGSFESEDEQGVLKILNDDSESDYYEEARKTPRKVRFGGEIVKLRTPESDSSHQTEEEDPEVTGIKITVTNAISIRTKKSLIPIRISSLPTTPKKVIYQGNTQYQYKSAPDLSLGNSRIPLRSNVKRKPKNRGTVTETIEQTIQSTTTNQQTPEKEKPAAIQKPKILKHSRGENVLSPIPIHNEIEVFHNLTRSPERSRRNSENTINEDENNDKINETGDTIDTKTFNSFTLYEENAATKIEETKEDKSLLVKEVAEENKLNISTKKPSLQQSLSSLTSDDEIWAKSEALDSLLKMLKEPGTCENLEAGPAALLFEALFACHHRDRLHNLADEALITLIQGITLQALEQCLPRLALSICKMGSSAGVRCALVVMKKLPPKKLQLEILTKGFGHRTREGALQILMACSRLYPRTDVEVTKIAEFAALALRDRRRRVRHAALETLAATAQNCSVAEVLSVVENSIRDYVDFDEIMQVVRTRLSRKQLPSVNLDGTIRYSSPTDQSESDWLSGAGIKVSNMSNTSNSPLSSASSSTPSVNYWQHNSRHVNQFNQGSTLIKQLSDFNGDDAFDDPAKIWAVDANLFQKNGKTSRGPKPGILRPVYILQPEHPPTNHVKNGRGHRKYDRGRSFSPPKHFKNPYQVESGEQSSFCNGYAHGNEGNKNFDYQDGYPHLQHPQNHGVFQPPGFRKSFSSDQLYFNDRLSQHNKQEPYSFSMSSRSSSTSTGSSTKSGLWNKDFRSAIPVPILEGNIKIRHSTSSVISTGRPLVAKRSAVSSPHTTPPPSKPPPKIPVDDDSISHLSLPPPTSSGSESSGYYTPSPPDKHHPPAFIKMETEERLNSDIDDNGRDFVDSTAPEKSVGHGIVNEVDKTNSSESSEKNDCLGESVHDNYSSVESLHLNNNEENMQQRPSSRHLMDLPGNLQVRRKSKSVIDLPNFLPNIYPSRKTINSAPPRHLDDNNLSNTRSHAVTSSVPSVATIDVAAEKPKNITTEGITVTKSKLERRFSRNTSRKSIKVTPRSQERPTVKPKEAFQQVLNQMENPNWETQVEGLQGLSRLVREHPEVIEHQIHQVSIVLAKHIKNLRSQVSRAACGSVTDLFMSCKKGLDMEVEEIACSLLQRTADTNKFLRADANAALDVMCEQLPAHRVVAVMTSKGCGHQNAVVRASAVRLLGDVVKRLGAERIYQLPKDIRDKLFVAGANALADGNLDARHQGKTLFKHLISHHNFQKCLHEAVPPNVLRHISKVLLSMRSGT